MNDEKKLTPDELAAIEKRLDTIYERKTDNKDLILHIRALENEHAIERATDQSDWAELWGVLRAIQIMTAPDCDTPLTVADIRALVLKGMGVTPEENPK